MERIMKKLAKPRSSDWCFKVGKLFDYGCYYMLLMIFKKPHRQSYVPMLEKLERRLQGWMSKLISRGGRFQLVCSVLSAIPIYFMNCFRLPKWVVNKIDKLRRDFLWGKSGSQNKGMSLINWDTVCLPKKWGGMGVSNLELQNICLLLRWWWRAYTTPEALWTKTATTLYLTQTYVDGPRIWYITGSFFWKQLLSIKPLFHWSTAWEVGDGTSISFWYDNWGRQPLRTQGERGARLTYQRASLRDAAPIHDILVPGLRMSVHMFSDDRDRLVWRWGSGGAYTANSIYQTLVGSGKVKWAYLEIWQCKAPTTAKIFAYLLLKGKILTRDILTRRGIQCDTRCAMCDSCPLETAHHLLFNCPYARRVWNNRATARLGMMRSMADSVQLSWTSSCNDTMATGTLTKLQWASGFVCTTWSIWKQRNREIFEGKRMPPEMLAEHILQESILWSKHC